MSKPPIPVPKGCHLLGMGRTFTPPNASFGAYVLYNGYESWMWEDHTSGNGRDHWYAMKVVDVVSTQPEDMTFVRKKKAAGAEGEAAIIAEAKALAGIKEAKKLTDDPIIGPGKKGGTVFTGPMPTPCDQSSCEISHFLAQPLDAIA